MLEKVDKSTKIGNKDLISNKDVNEKCCNVNEKGKNSIDVCISKDIRIK